MTYQAIFGGLVAAIGWAPLAAQAQTTVANYATGQPGTATYEQLSLWVKNGQRANIQYTYGKNGQTVPLRYAGQSQLRGRPGFQVQFANRHTLYLVPSGTTLLVAASPTAAPKTFAWEYEGPVNGVGTFCSVCAEDAPAAMRLLRTYYLK